MKAQPLKIIDPKNVDSNSAVLVDGLSIRACANFDQSRAKADSDRGIYAGRVWYPPKPSAVYEVPRAYAFIQSMVVYEHVLVDSFILQGRSDAPSGDFCKRFPSVFLALNLGLDAHTKLVEELRDYIPNDGCFFEPRTFRKSQLPFAERVREFTLLMHDHDAERFLQPFSPKTLPRGEWSVFRAHYYLELARRLGVYLSPHESRAGYFQAIIAQNNLAKLPTNSKGLPEKIIHEIDREIRRRNAKFLEPISVGLPPVAEWIMRKAIRHKIDYKEAIMEARESKNARRFRKWCAEMTALSRHGRAGVRAAQQIRRELQEVCEVWREDLDEEIRYKTRKLDLCKLPLIGGILSTLGITVMRPLKDPVLAVDKPYFLLLNDLYR